MERHLICDNVTKVSKKI